MATAAKGRNGQVTQEGEALPAGRRPFLLLLLPLKHIFTASLLTLRTFVPIDSLTQNHTPRLSRSVSHL